MANILVAGGTGYLGRYMLRTLKERGFRIRAIARNAGSLSKTGAHLAPAAAAYTDEVVEAEITRPDTLKGVCDGMDIVFSSVGITRQKDGATYRDVDYGGNVNLLEEAVRANVGTFMYISVFRGDEISGMLNDWKEQFVNRLKQAPIRHVVVRPTGYFSDMEEFLQMATKGRVYLIGSGRKRMNPIHGADLAEFCADSLPVGNADLDVGGPAVYTHREIARLAFLAAGKRERITAIPSGLFKLALSPLKIVSPGNYGALQFLYNALTHDMVAPEHGTRNLLRHFEEMAAKN